MLPRNEGLRGKQMCAGVIFRFETHGHSAGPRRGELRLCAWLRAGLTPSRPFRNTVGGKAKTAATSSSEDSGKHGKKPKTSSKPIILVYLACTILATMAKVCVCWRLLAAIRIQTAACYAASWIWWYSFKSFSCVHVTDCAVADARGQDWASRKFWINRCTASGCSEWTQWPAPLTVSSVALGK